MENLKTQIRKFALDFFVDKGIETVSSYDIALQSKIRFSVLEEYYPSKMDLVTDIYIKAEADMFQFVYGDLIELKDFKTLMRKLFHQSAIWALDNPKQYLFMEYVQSQPYIWNKETGIYPTVNQPILNRIKEAIEAGIVKDLPTDFIVHLMMKMLNSCVTYIVSLRTVIPEEYEALIEPMFECCWDALKNE